MSSTIKSIINAGNDGVVIDAECHLSNGLPAIIIVGLGGKAIDEAKERIRASFAQTNIQMPRKRVVINLAPADIPKESTSLDLAIAAAILQSSQQLKQTFDSTQAVIGELGLNGTIRAVRGIIGKLLAGKKVGIKTFFIPANNLQQALLVPGIKIIPLATIGDLYKILTANDPPIATDTGNGTMSELDGNNTFELTMSDVIGQAAAKRAMTIAAAGGHNIFLNGPPGTGKSMLAKALPSILPPLSQEEMLEVTHLHSLGSGNYDQLVTARPFRTPHHSASHVAIVGGGHNLRPGEISLSHRGVLFFDELPEFNRTSLEALRQPLEDRTVTISRAKDSITFPAHFILVATANPCPCGYWGTTKSCHCSAHTVLQYRRKLSGPIMDRIDLYVNVENVEHDRLLSQPNTRSNDQARQAVEIARKVQADRYNSPSKLNADLSNREIKNKAQISKEALNLLNEAAKHLDISARSYMRIVKVARTIADLESSVAVDPPHISEALQYRARSAELIE